MRFKVRVQPRAARSEIVGKHGEALKVRLAAPPVDGAANGELIALLAKRLGVAKSAVTIVRGERSREKLIEVEGVTADAVRALVQSVA